MIATHQVVRKYPSTAYTNVQDAIAEISWIAVSSRGSCTCFTLTSHAGAIMQEEHRKQQAWCGRR